MFALKKIVTYLILLPPGNVIVLLLLLGIYLFWKKLYRSAKLTCSAYHMPRSVYLFQKAGFEKGSIVPVPVDYKASHSVFTFYKLLPTSYWLNVSSKALKEYFGLLYYWLKN